MRQPLFAAADRLRDAGRDVGRTAVRARRRTSGESPRLDHCSDGPSAGSARRARGHHRLVAAERHRQRLRRREVPQRRAGAPREVLRCRSQPRDQAVSLRAAPIQSTEIRDALSLGDQAADAEGLERLFARAVLLHTDIALLQPSRRPVEDPAERPSTLIVEDGRERGTLRIDTDFEWKCATSFIGLLPPAGADDFARRWYRSIIGYLRAGPSSAKRRRSWNSR